MIKLHRNPNCDLCPLHEGCHTVCVPTRPWRPLPTPGGGPAPFANIPLMHMTHALLIVGEAPGYHEDQSGEGFVGPAGTYLDHIYVRGMGLPCLAHVYLANAVRCRPPGNRNPTATQLRLCRPYLVDDLLRLQAHYGTVTILCVGAIAVKSLLGWSLKNAFGQQGHDLREIGTGKHAHDVNMLDTPMRVFSTFHPAVLLPGRDPSKIAYVKRHLALLKSYLQTGSLPTIETPQYAVALLPPDPLPRQVALDIETYGILKGYNQTVFHPAKSAHWDRTEPRLVVTVALSWWDSSGEGVKSAIFDMGRQDHRVKLHWWLCVLQAEGSELLCMNTQFDIQYLRAIPMFRKVLEPPLCLWDLSISNYLSEDSRPERSLADVSQLYGVTRYAPGFRQYASPTDPDLWAYNVQDAYATLKTERLMRDEIGGWKGTAKQSDFTRVWYSDLLWSVIHMSEAGSTFDLPRLERLDARLSARLDWLSTVYENDYDVPLCGKGSMKGLIELFGNAVGHAGLWDHDELVFTDKLKRVSTGDANLNLLLNHLPLMNERHCLPGIKDGRNARAVRNHHKHCGRCLRDKLRLLRRFRSTQKLMTSYVRPLLHGRDKDQLDKSPTLIEDRCYPSWFVVPSRFDEGTEGGTNQARITCKGPALQTAPGPIKSCFSTRFDPGVRLHADYKQLELGVAALLSGDRQFMHDFEHEDIHWRTARLVAEVLGVSDPDQWATKWRKWGGKTQNFRALYRGGAPRFQAVLRSKGIDIRLDDCEAVDAAFWKRYPRLWDWQEELIETAKTKGYIDLPLIGQSRRFLGSRKTIDSTYIQTIVNLPVQAVAACICESAQIEIVEHLRTRNLSSLLVLNCYDSLDLECPACETDLMMGLLKRVMPTPPYYRALCGELGRDLPLTIDLEIIARKGLPDDVP